MSSPAMNDNPSRGRRSHRPVLAGRLGALLAACLGLAALAAVWTAGSPASSSALSAKPCEASAARRIPQPSSARMAAAGLGKLPVAAAGKRVDLVAPRFTHSTRVTNPLFPIARLQSVVLNGHVDGKAFRTETTLMPETQVIEWSPGQCVETLVSQYFAYLDGRIEEVALDFYAQADDGSVWYFGEDVYNYRDGLVLSTDGTWRAGKEGPAAMIMPAAPKVGDVHRPENIPGLVWEEVAVKAVGETVNGPRGEVAGALVGRELHDDGSFSDKVFAPGYGEFSSAHRGDLEALALAVPTDARSGAVPVSLRTLLREAYAAFDAAGSGRWASAVAASARVEAAWSTHRAGSVPPRLFAPTTRAVAALDRAVTGRNARATRHSALDVALAVLDLQLQYRSQVEIDRDRFDLWLRQILVDAGARDTSGVVGDVATLEWMRDRIARSLGGVELTRVDYLLGALRANADDEEFAAAARNAQTLRGVLARS